MATPRAAQPARRHQGARPAHAAARRATASGPSTRSSPRRTSSSGSSTTCCWRPRSKPTGSNSAGGDRPGRRGRAPRSTHWVARTASHLASRHPAEPLVGAGRPAAARPGLRQPADERGQVLARRRRDRRARRADGGRGARRGGRPRGRHPTGGAAAPVRPLLPGCRERRGGRRGSGWASTSPAASSRPTAAGSRWSPSPAAAAPSRWCSHCGVVGSDESRPSAHSRRRSTGGSSLFTPAPELGPLPLLPLAQLNTASA